MKFHAIFWPLVFYASAVAADKIDEPPVPPGIPPGNIYMAGSPGSQAEDSGLAATAVSTEYTTHNSSADISLSSSERVISVTRAWSAARTWTLACAGTVPAGQSVQIIDPARLLLSTNSLTIVPASTGCPDTLNGKTTNTEQLTSPGSRAVAISDGSSNWSVTVIGQNRVTVNPYQKFAAANARDKL